MDSSGGTAMSMDNLTRPVGSHGQDGPHGQVGRKSRREVLTILAVGGAGVAAWRLGLLDRGGKPVARTSRDLMGTTVNLTVVSDDREAAEAAVQATIDRMTELERRLSRYRDDSEVSRLVADGSIDRASEGLLEVLRLAERVARMGDGAFDVTIQPVLDLYRQHLAERHQLPPREAIEQARALVGSDAIRIDGHSVTLDRPGASITLDGIGKGYIVDQGVAELKRRGWPDVFVEAGGDLVASGEKRVGAAWRVGIRSPRRGLAVQARLDARDTAVATSGDYMQPFTPDFSQHHIVDPRTGLSSPDLASSTVVAPDAATADALATLTMVLGPSRSRELLEELPGCEGYLVTKNLDVVKTTGMRLA